MYEIIEIHFGYDKMKYLNLHDYVGCGLFKNEFVEFQRSRYSSNEYHNKSVITIE
jgi:hypothetical protein